MKYVFTPTVLLKHARRGALLLALGAAGPAAWGQSFGPVSLYSTNSGGRPNSVALGDMNQDGRLDIVAACPGPVNGVAVVLLGQAGGGFASGAVYSTGSGSQPISVAVGDLNADGRMDIATANHGTGAVSVLYGQTSGFATANSYSVGGGSMPQSIALRDVNNDGKLDIVTANANSTVGVLLGQSTGFATVTTYPASSGSGPQDIAIGDINGDGRQDLVTANVASNTSDVFLGQTVGSFAALSTFSTGNGSQPYAVLLNDVSGDGKLDIITANYFTNDVRVLVQQSSGFAQFSAYTAGSNSHPQGIVLGDVNGDSQLDILTANAGSGNVGVLLGQAGGRFALASGYSIGLGGNPVDVALGDVNGDGRPDVITANSTNSVAVLLNTGTYTPLATARPAAADFTIAPNPAHDGFVVQLPAGLAPTSTELLNALGQVVRRPAVGPAASFRVETNGLAPGIYTLRLQAGGAALARRVAVE